jgi:nitric oxide reductase activation protein
MEWDYRLRDYLNDHVLVTEKQISPCGDGFYQKTLVKHRALVQDIRYAFEMIKPEEMVILRQWIDGDAFDYKALLDFAMDKRAGITPSDRLYIKRLKQQRDVSVLLLVDLSRSTINPVYGSHSSVLDVEKEAIVLFCEALSVLGDDFAVAGFSGSGRLGVEYIPIKEFDENMNTDIAQRIGAVSPRRSTRMGAAIRHAADILDHIPSRVRLLIILGDGFPNDIDYKQTYAIEDTRKAIQETRSKQIHTHAITVNLSEHPKLDRLYGHFNHTIISDVFDLPDKLLRIYSGLTLH